MQKMQKKHSYYKPNMSYYRYNGLSPFNDDWEDRLLRELEKLAPEAPKYVLEEAINESWDDTLSKQENILHILQTSELRPYVNPWIVAIYELNTRLKGLPTAQIGLALRRNWNPNDMRGSIERTYQQLTR
jgi:hypothetical protein